MESYHKRLINMTTLIYLLRELICLPYILHNIIGILMIWQNQAVSMQATGAPRLRTVAIISCFVNNKPGNSINLEHG